LSNSHKKLNELLKKQDNSQNNIISTPIKTIPFNLDLIEARQDTSHDSDAADDKIKVA